MRDKYNIIPMFNASVLHAGIVVSLLFAFDWTAPVAPQIPLVLKGRLITDTEIPEPPAPPPDIEPEPEADTSEQERIEAEEQKRQEDLRIERQRIAREEEVERQRQQQAESERKKREEAELERQRQEAERRRLEEIERQRLDNERRRQEAEDAEEDRRRLAELQDEQDRLDAMNASALDRYRFAIQQAIVRNFIRTASAPDDLECLVKVRQIPGGQVIDVEIVSCNGDDAVRRSVEAAVFKASPLPLPDDPKNFQRDLQIRFKPEQ